MSFCVASNNMLRNILAGITVSSIPSLIGDGTGEDNDFDDIPDIIPDNDFDDIPDIIPENDYEESRKRENDDSGEWID